MPLRSEPSSEPLLCEVYNGCDAYGGWQRTGENLAQARHHPEHRRGLGTTNVVLKGTPRLAEQRWWGGAVTRGSHSDRRYLPGLIVDLGAPPDP